MSMGTTLTSNSYNSKYVWFLCRFIALEKILKILRNGSNESYHSSKFTVLVIVAYATKAKRKTNNKQVECLMSILVLVSESNLFCASCIYWVIENEYDKYFKLWR